jgi:hypothetical protein
MLLGLENKVASILQLVVRFKRFVPNGQMITYARALFCIPPSASPSFPAISISDPDHFPA